MLKKISVAACVMVFMTSANASDVVNKCIEWTTPLGANDPETQCECFEDKLTEDQKEEYIAMSDWESEATGELSAVGEACFPELH